MVLGLDKVAAHLGGFATSYTIIGGAACFTHFKQLDQEFRATKDIDMVLRVDSVDTAFAKALKNFLDAGGYEARQRGAEGAREYYRFHKPTASGYPSMLELFIRNAAVADKIAESQEIARLEVDDDLVSLSAIILDDDYFEILSKNSQIEDGISILSIEMLIAFKAKAYCDLARRKDAGDTTAKGDDIKKHRNDVFRLLSIIPPTTKATVPNSIHADISQYSEAITRMGDDFKPSSFAVNLSVAEGLNLLGSIFVPADRPIEVAT